MMELIDKYLGEIILGTGTSIFLGIWGMIWSFFKGIKSLKTKVAELEGRIEANEKSDDELKDWVNLMIRNKMK